MLSAQESLQVVSRTGDGDSADTYSATIAFAEQRCLMRMDAGISVFHAFREAIPNYLQVGDATAGRQERVSPFVAVCGGTMPYENRSLSRRQWTQIAMRNDSVVFNTLSALVGSDV
jgi:hypothetical protein